MFNQHSVAFEPTQAPFAQKSKGRIAHQNFGATAAIAADLQGQKASPIHSSLNGSPSGQMSSLNNQPIPIMEWWKLKALAEVSPRDLPRLKRSICGFEIIGDTRWRSAEAGEVSAAIAVAIRLVKQGLIATPVMNLAGTALLIAAVKGDATARLMIEYLACLKNSDCAQRFQSNAATTVHQLRELIAAEMEACT